MVLSAGSIFLQYRCGTLRLESQAYNTFGVNQCLQWIIVLMSLHWVELRKVLFSNFDVISKTPVQFETTLHARKFLEFKDHVGPSHGLHFDKLLKQCEGIVYSTIRSNAQIFNTIIDDRSMVHLLIDLDSAFADSMLEELLQKDVHIPLFYENKESALSCAIAKGKAKVVRLLLK